MKSFTLAFFVSCGFIILLNACSAEIKNAAQPQPVIPEGRVDNVNPTLPIGLQTSKTGEEKYNNFKINSSKTHYTVIFDFNTVKETVELSFGKAVEGLQGCFSSDVTRSYSWWTKDANGNYVALEPLSETSHFTAVKGQSYSLLVDIAGSQKCYSYSYDFIVKERIL